MLKHKYDKRLISGTICAGGSLGTITPPSVVAVVIASLANVSVGELFVAIIVPGLMLAGAYMVYIVAICTIKPEYGPRVLPSPDDPSFSQKIRFTLYALVPPLLMVTAVLGSLIMGLAAPTEAAALGALCSFLLTLFYRRFTFTILYDSLLTTLRITSMILLILLGGNMFAGVFTGAGGMSMIQNLVDTLQFGKWALLFLALGLTFLLPSSWNGLRSR
ncbi:TRAP transporter large permease subunit [Paenalcaligenes niemegkensis]|nr:TRAP transporter large permease subunit [Paenalcaligenes niemegkensis]MCQ9618185.1 TRAP transporter large permease subunit [Paenalcaligenes niemegkensis]